MIGKFDRDSIEDHEERFKNGKLPLREAKVAKQNLQFTEIDCQAQVLEAASDDDDDFDEILQEILAEERARRQAEGDDDDLSSRR